MNRAPLFLAFGLTLSLALPGQAYISSGIQLVENMSARRAKLKLRDVTALLTAEVDAVDTPVEERIFVKSPERLRLVQELPDETTIYIEREGARATGTEASMKKLPGASTEMLAALLMPRGEDNGGKATRLISLLRRAGVNTKVTALGIYGDDVRSTAYIIGARSWETDKPQLWIDRENFQPVRLIMKADGVLYESRFTGYGSPTGGAWFPETIENYRDGKLVRRSRLNEIRTNEDLPETLFAIP
ncbi:MAG: hypothetical protein AAF654_08870 [Myxococcota bacterium]